MMKKKTSIGVRRVINSDGWGKSSYCGASNTCVEVRNWRTASASGFQDCVEAGSDNERVHIRDSKNKDMPHIVLSRSQFETFLIVLKNL